MIRMLLAALLFFSPALFAADEIAASATDVHPLLLGGRGTG